jgi:Sec-independent protein translocase protein TatA
LPEIARTLGKGMAELRRASNELKSSLEDELRNLERPAESSTPDRVEDRAEGITGAVPKYGDYHSEPTPDESRTRT